MTDERTMKTKLYLKHSMSCLGDLGMEVDVDDARREVSLTMLSFDSNLVATAVTRILPEEHGVVAFRDDADKDDAWLTRPAPYGLLILVAGTAYRAQVVKLLDRRDVAVTLTPITKQPSES